MPRFARPIALALIALLGGAVRPGAQTPPIDPYDAAIAARFAKEIDCVDPQEPNRHWCAVTRILSAQAKPVPPTTVTYIGATVSLKDDEGVRAATLARTAISALHFGGSGIRLVTLGSSNEDEKKMLLASLLSAGAVLKGLATTIEVAKDLGDFLDADRAKPLRAVTANGPALDYQGANLPGRAYQLDNEIVVIERAPGAAFVNVYPIAEVVKK